ncbi:MAG: N-acetylmuramoyl-L-alanine amidase [Caldilineales bacterium]|nr:N-acetylmuramoyl-L-alanine amidase [Caldilineales bacterium]
MHFARLQRLHTWLGRALGLSLLALVVVVVWGSYQGTLTPGRAARVLGRWGVFPGLPSPWQVALIAGHRGHDSGAVCADGLQEVTITTAVADRTAAYLRRRGADVLVLDEYDPRLTGLRAEALVSIHADSCIDLTGFKVAGPAETVIPEADRRLVHCLETAYARASGLKQHPNTITRNMTGYHAFQRVAPETPGAIIELGFLGADRALLQTGQEHMARGIAEGILCFLEGQGEW